jgi:hypothetical protein
MNLFIGCFGLLICAVSLAACISPGLLNAVTSSIRVSTTLRLMAGFIRILLGVAFFYSAPATALPQFVRIAGLVIGIAGVGLLFMPTQMMQKVIDWFASAATNARLVGVAGILVGVPFAYAGLAVH